MVRLARAAGFRRLSGCWVAVVGLGGYEAGAVAGRAGGGAGQRAFGPGDGDEPGGCLPLLQGHCLPCVVDELAEGVVGLRGAGEAVAVGAFELVLGHPRGVVAVAVGGDGGLLVLVAGGGAVDQVRGHGAGRDVGYQHAAGAVGRGERREGEAGQVGVDVVADPLGVLLRVHLGRVDAGQFARGVLDPEDDQAAAGVGHRGDVLGQFVPPSLARGLGKVFLPVQVVGLRHAAGSSLGDHAEVQRAGRQTEVLVQSCPGTGHARHPTAVRGQAAGPAFFSANGYGTGEGGFAARVAHAPDSRVSVMRLPRAAEALGSPPVPSPALPTGRRDGLPVRTGAAGRPGRR